MNVFRVTVSYETAQQIAPVEELASARFRGQEAGSDWENLAWVLRDPDQSVTPLLMYYQDNLMMTAEVMESPLGELVRRAGQIFEHELVDTGETIYMSNVLEIYHCLDVPQSTFRHFHPPKRRKGELGIGIAEAVVKRSAVGASDMFRFPEDPGRIALVNDEQREPEDSFYHTLISSPWLSYFKLAPWGELVD